MGLYNLLNDFIKAFNSGKICVHPTDTIFGFTCNHKDKVVVDKLKNYKKRSSDKPF